MIALQTTLFYFLGLCLAFLCGYGILRYLLPEDLQEYRFVIAIPTGYSIFAWLAFTISGALSIVVSKSVWLSLAILSGITLAALFTSPLGPDNLFCSLAVFLHRR